MKIRRKISLSWDSSTVASFRRRKKLWAGVTAVCVFLRVVFPEFWDMIEGITITYMSGYALYATFDGGEQGAKAVEAVENSNDSD